jgi:phosphatidylinositol 3,5-bisphosphate 5-phosphatase
MAPTGEASNNRDADSVGDGAGTLLNAHDESMEEGPWQDVTEHIKLEELKGELGHTFQRSVVSTAEQAETNSTRYPQLSRTSPTQFSPDALIDDRLVNRDEGEATAECFDRTEFPTVALKRNKAALVGKVGEDGVSRMHKFSLYETAMYFYVVGGDLLDQRFRILKIARSESGDLNIQEDDIVYTKRETNQILNAIDERNRSSGGLKLKASFWGLLGFIRFTGPYYMLYVTKRSQVAMIGGHYVYQVDGTEMLPLTPTLPVRTKSDKHPEEPRFVGILNNLDLTRSFYFSYSYDATRTLQHNIMRERQALQEGLPEPLQHDHNDMFVWNHHLLEPAKKAMANTYDWCLSIIHGYVDQAALSVYWGRVVYVTIIARRSRFFAGARYLKRGANDLGYVANDVETEQIVSEMLTTSFHAPGPTLFANPNYTSYVQHRGSIPLFWTQDSTGVSPKPDIELNLVDPFYSAAAMHFDNLFDRYGAPIYVLDLVKSKERLPRESKLLKEYRNAINYLNQFLPEGKKIEHHEFDMSRASKSRDQDVIGSLEAIADNFVPKTGIFRNGSNAGELELQNGVVRTNCIDCLDRTNAAQFVISKKAFGHQLYSLGVIDDPNLEYDSDAVNLFTHMWHDHGDTIAIQYGGSHLVNTMATYRKINQWTSHSRDMVESFKRYYNNSFMDAQRQEAYNLFLGNYIFAQKQPLLWDLSTDYYLHHSDPRSWSGKRRPSYRKWFKPEHLDQPGIPPAIWSNALAKKPLQYFDDYWLEYYRPLALSSFKKVFTFKMHSNLRYTPIHSAQEGRYDLSPFKVRKANDADTAKHDKDKHNGQRRKGVRIVDPSDASTANTDASIDARLASSVESAPTPKPNTLGPWLDAQQLLHKSLTSQRYTGLIKEPSFEKSTWTLIPPLPSSATLSPQPLTKAEQDIVNFTLLVANSLHPTVSDAEEYERYVAHPLALPLVVSSNIENKKAPEVAEFAAYLGRVQDVIESPSTYDAHNLNGNDRQTGAAEMEAELRLEERKEEFKEFLEVREEGLSVLEDDGAQKRYKVYRKWLKGKSLFKQRPISGELG